MKHKILCFFGFHKKQYAQKYPNCFYKDRWTCVKCGKEKYGTNPEHNFHGTILLMIVAVIYLIWSFYNG